MFKNALVSVSNKTGLDRFLEPYKEKGIRIVSTGGTAQFLRDRGFNVIDVSEQTDFPEVLDGRVKTLHPKIHMALLARAGIEQDRETLASYGIEPFDLVVGNLYPFAENLEKFKSGEIGDLQELSEFIDIGGPSFLRAAAKNFARITVVCDPGDYDWINKKNDLGQQERQNLAGKVFRHVASYDAMIADTLITSDELANVEFALGGYPKEILRYGENPQQQAIWYRKAGTAGWHDAEVLQGKALSYNNLLDLQAALSTLQEFSNEPYACVSVKHNNPCGVAVAQSGEDAVARSLGADPVSVFGGIVAVSSEVTGAMAEHLKGVFLECVVAPGFSKEAREILKSKTNLRLLQWPEALMVHSNIEIKSLFGGFLVQKTDQVSMDWQDSWIVHGEAPSESIKKDLLTAWKICAHLKSNAICIVGGGMSLGLGMGQVNRVDAVEQAIQRMSKFHSDKDVPVLASDAFFPFPDSIEKAAEAGIQWVIQPGGSKKDSEVIAKAKDLKVNLVLTGQRHFLH